MAIGAGASRVTRTVLSQRLRVTIGMSLGGGASIPAVRVLRSWMYEMSVYDAQTFVACAALCGVALSRTGWGPIGASWRSRNLMQWRSQTIIYSTTSTLNRPSTCAE